MKKLFIAIVTTVLFFTLMISTVACETKSEEDKFKDFTDAVNAAFNTAAIDQSIEVKNGDLLVYSLEKSYMKREGGYSVTGEEKRLNEVGAEEAYTITTIDETVQKADTFTTSLVLSEEVFQSYEIKDGKLTASVNGASVNKVFGLNGSHAEMREVKLVITIGGERVEDFKVSFQTNNYVVHIVLTFAY